MSGQCLSASGAGRALTPARRLRLGGPSPHRLPDTTWARRRAVNLCSPEVIRYYPPSRTAIPDPAVGTHALLPLTPVPPLLGFPRLACLIHAANVRSEPGSNPSNVFAKPAAAGSQAILGRSRRCSGKTRTQTAGLPTTGRPAAASRLAEPEPAQHGRPEPRSTRLHTHLSKTDMSQR